VLSAIMVHVVQSIVGSNRCHHNAHQKPAKPAENKKWWSGRRPEKQD